VFLNGVTISEILHIQNGFNAMMFYLEILFKDIRQRRRNEDIDESVFEVMG
jgi:hypothetical protein